MENEYLTEKIIELMDMADFLYKKGILYKIGYTDDWQEKKSYYSIGFGNVDDEVSYEFYRRFGIEKI